MIKIYPIFQSQGGLSMTLSCFWYKVIKTSPLLQEPVSDSSSQDFSTYVWQHTYKYELTIKLAQSGHTASTDHN